MIISGKREDKNINPREEPISKTPSVIVANLADFSGNN